MHSLPGLGNQVDTRRAEQPGPRNQLYPRVTGLRSVVWPLWFIHSLPGVGNQVDTDVLNRWKTFTTRRHSIAWPLCFIHSLPGVGNQVDMERTQHNPTLPTCNKALKVLLDHSVSYTLCQVWGTRWTRTSWTTLATGTQLYPRAAAERLSRPSTLSDLRSQQLSCKGNENSPSSSSLLFALVRSVTQIWDPEPVPQRYEITLRCLRSVTQIWDPEPVPAKVRNNSSLSSLLFALSLKSEIPEPVPQRYEITLRCLSLLFALSLKSEIQKPVLAKVRNNSSLSSLLFALSLKSEI